ncbi:predicted transcriptional regulator [Vibrio sp. JCM 18905]|nr:predicted transcriptional regulator [Vibrio sp. JCM 18905]
MKTVDRILQIVKRDGSVTAKQLSSELGMTTMGGHVSTFRV